MNELVGFKNINYINDISLIKRELLLFDKIFIVGYQEWKDVFEDDNIKSHEDIIRKKGLIPLNDFVIYQGNVAMKEHITNSGGLENYYNATKTDETDFRNQNLQYLFDQGKLIFEYDKLEKGQNYFNAHKEINPVIEHKIKIGMQNQTSDFFQLCIMSHDLKTRILTSSSTMNKSTLIPCNSSLYEVQDITTIKAQVYNLILEDFPILNIDLLSWDEIFDFKSDPDIYNSIWSLRNWISTISKSEKNIVEIEEEYRELKYKYEQAIKIHKLKTSSSIFQTTIQTGAELMENIARLKFSKVADLFFKFKENQISLMENELKSDGNQLSYLFKIQDKFQ